MKQKQVLKGYRFRIYPNKTQIREMINTFGCVRKYWNILLNENNIKVDMKKEGYDVDFTVQDYTFYLDICPYFSNVSSMALQQCRMDFNKALKNMFSKRAKRPKFKSKKDYAQSYRVQQVNNCIKIIDKKHVQIPKLGVVSAVITRMPTSKIRNATISMTSTGKFYVSFAVEEVVTAYEKTGKSTGFDMGIKDFFVMNNGERVANQHFFKDIEEKLAKEKKILSRRALRAQEEGRELAQSKNYQKQRIKVARLYEEYTNKKNDFLHKASSGLIKNYDLICMEDLNTSGLLKNSKLAKAISECGWGEFKRQLLYKADWYDKTIVFVSRFYPSTQTCSCCGSVLTGDNKLTLKDREWTCSECGVHHDRDINAAVNILNEGTRLIHTTSPDLFPGLV